MKQLIAILVLSLVLALTVAGMVSAQYSQENWRVYFKAIDTAGSSQLGDMTVGVHSAAKDGYGVDGPTSDSNDARAVLSSATTGSVVGVFDNKAWIRDIKSPRLPSDPAYNAGQPVGAGNGNAMFGTYPWESNRKIWDLRVAGLGSASTLDSLLTIKLVSAAAGLPPTRLQVRDAPEGITAPVNYMLRMVDNRGITGAPANGTVWTIPMPATWQTASLFSLTLPTFNISVARDEAAMLNEGYKIQFIQEVVPEPSSLLALAFGLGGLGMLRRRKN
jgi:hypothetical protein